MISKKNRVFFAVFLCLAFTAIPHLYGQQQQSYNPIALDYFKRSLESLIVGDYQNAIFHCNQVIRIDPNSAVTYVVRARAYYELNEYDKAIADSSQALRLDRNNAAAFTIRGNAYAQNGDLTRAISNWQAALRINPEIDEARHNIELAQQRRSQQN